MHMNFAKGSSISWRVTLLFRALDTIPGALSIPVRPVLLGITRFPARMRRGDSIVLRSHYRTSSIPGTTHYIPDSSTKSGGGRIRTGDLQLRQTDELATALLRAL